MSEAITEIIERIVAIASGLGFLLPFAIVLILRMFSGKSNSPEQQQQPRAPQQQPRPQPRTAARPESSPQQPAQGESIPIPGFPFAPPAWMEMMQPKTEEPAAEARPSQWREPARPESQWGHTFDRNDDREEEGLQWGSAFDYEDGEPLRWGSTFDSDQGKTRWEKTKYGFEKAEWGKTFPKKDSEPVVHFG